MSKYEKYKPSAIAWIGDVPTEWKVNRIKNVVDIFGRIGFRGYTVADIVNDGEGAISLSPSNIIDQKIVLENSTYISFFKYDESPEIQIQNEDVILVKTASVGKAIYVEGLTEKTTINPQLVVFKNYKIHRKFFYYTVISNVIQGQITKDTAGGVIGTVTQQAINNYKIVIPSKAEQLTIANYLDDQTHKIDRLIANKKGQAEKLKELRQIEINNAVTKGLNPNAELKDSGIDWLGKIPKHWELKRLKNLANQISEKSTEILDDDFLVALENIESNTGKFIETASEYESNGIKFKKGNLLYNKLRPYLNKVFQADKDGVCVGDIIVIECTQRLHPTFLQYRMLSDAFCSVIMSSVYGAKMPRTSWQYISSLKIVYPSFDEQVQIAEHLNKRTIAIENLIQNINLQIEKLQELRKIKIYEAVTGKIKVNAYAETTA